MKNSNKAVHLTIRSLATLTLTLAIQGYATAMTVPSTEIVAGTPEPVIKEISSAPTNKEESANQTESKCSDSDEPSKTVDKETDH